MKTTERQYQKTIEGLEKVLEDARKVRQWVAEQGKPAPYLDELIARGEAMVNESRDGGGR